MSTTHAPSCASCRHVDIEVDGEAMAMTCHRYPPQVIVFDQADGMGVQAWPEVETHDHCGEWQHAADCSCEDDR